MGAHWELIWQDGTLTSPSGQFLMAGTLTECATAFEGVVIKTRCTVRAS